MAIDNNEQPLKITLDDLANVVVEEQAPVFVPSTGPTGQRTYGTITDAADKAPAVAEERGSILLQGWFYLGSAGLLGAVAGWGLCEHAFVDGEGHRWGNIWLIPLMVTLMCLGFGIAESLVERSVSRAFRRGGLALILGIVFGFVFDVGANIVFNIGLSICGEAGVQSYRNPAVWVARGIAWAAFGVAGGLVYGIAGQSMKKAKFGVIGGMIGAGLGGLVFDPISMLTHGGAPSRAVGLALVGVATGVAMGFVESAMKDRWFYVTAGPLAGKQFILYKNQTVIGSEQQCDIYLFKDQTILPQHAVIGIAGSRVQVRALGHVYVSGVPVQQRVLQDGDLIQIGRYAFRYKERHRS